MDGLLRVRRTVVCQIPGVLALLLALFGTSPGLSGTPARLSGTSDPANVALLMPNLALLLPLRPAFSISKHRVIAARFRSLRSSRAYHVGAQAAANHRGGGKGFAVWCWFPLPIG